METLPILKGRHGSDQELSRSEDSNLSTDLNENTYVEVVGSLDNKYCEQFKGWNDVKPDQTSCKRQLFSDLIEKYVFGLLESVERDIIDGITFLSFISSEDLTNYSIQQERMQYTASQSDDGLEIMDDSSCSDISSNRVIVPTKTNDITKIKGWRKKQFGGLRSSNSSELSVRNNDDGFGEDRSSDVIFSDCQASNADYENEELQIETGVPLESWDKEINSLSLNNVEESQSANIAGIQTSSNTKEKNFDSSNEVSDRRDASSDPSFIDSKRCDMMPKSPLARDFKISSPISLNITTESEPLKPDLPSAFEPVYQPRVKQNFLLSIEKKLLGDSPNINSENSLSSNINPLGATCSPPTNENRQSLCWRVPNQSLLSGSIFDVSEVSSKCDDIIDSFSSADSSFKLKSDFEDTLGSLPLENKSTCSSSSNRVFPKDNSSKITEAFLSSILDKLTKKPSELLIEFELPKLDAANNVTHKEHNFPTLFQKSQIPTPPKVVKPLNAIKAKTLAEKRKILEQMNRKNTRAHKVPPMKFRDTEDKMRTRLSKNDGAKEKQQIESLKKKTNSKNKLTKKKFETNCFDQNGAFSYGKEKPLRSLFPGSELSFSSHESNSDNKVDVLKNDCGMILNVGPNRPLYKEAWENIGSLLKTDGLINEDFAKFAVAAVQTKALNTIIVTRFLVPVFNKNLRNILSILKPSQINEPTKESLNTRDSVKELLLFEYKTESVFPEHLQSSSDSLEVKESICTTVNHIINYVEKRDYFNRLQFGYDPDVPVPIEKEDQVKQYAPVLKLKTKKKKTKLQRQIEQLGGTFISMEEEEQSQIQAAKVNCGKEHCLKGCICCFLKSSSTLHCGKASCILECSCSSAENQIHLVRNRLSLLPEAKHIQKNLAPVEREFHQTVIMSKNNQTITVESSYKKRERKVPSKYKENFLDSINCEEVIKNISSTSKNLTPPKSLPEKSKSSHDDIGVSKNKITKLSSETVSNNKVAKPRKVNRSSNKQSNENKQTTDRSHLSDNNDHCSRTKVVPNYYHERNCMRILRLKAGVLYATEEFQTELDDDPIKDDSLFIKDDLDTGLTQTENEYNTLQEDESGLAIEFVCSLPPENFEKLESAETLEEFSTISKESPNEPTEKTCSMSIDISKNKTERIVYATLPTTETDCKWWVVELNSDLFTHLVYSSDKRCLSVEIINKLIFNAEHTQKTIRCSLKKHVGSFQDIFGAYAVLGHKHLVFFGPYDIAEGHGVTAINKKDDAEEFSRVPFTTNFSSSACFESLGIKRSGTGEISSEHHARAVWWYSKKSELNNTGREETKSVGSLEPSSSMPDPSLGKETLCQNKDPETFSDHSHSVFSSSRANTKPEDAVNEKSSSGPENVDVNNPTVSTENPLDCYEDIVDKHNTHQSDIDNFNSLFSKSLKNIHGNTDQDYKETQENSHKPAAENLPVNKRLQGKRKLKRKLVYSRKRPRIDIGEKERCKPAILRKRNRPVRQPNLEELSSLPKNGQIPQITKEMAEKNKRKRNSNLPDLIPIQEIDLSKEDMSDSSSTDNDLIDDDWSDSISHVETNTKKRVSRRLLIHTSTSSKSTARREIKSGALPSNLVMKTPNPSPGPEFAMICMTPGIGYIPVTHFSHDRIILADPLNDNNAPCIEHSFDNPDQASEWLQEEFKKRMRFKVKSDMSWRLVKGSLIKYLQPLNPAIFRLSPRYLEVTERGLETTLPEIRRLQNDPIMMRKACDERLRRSILKESFINLQKVVFDMESDSMENKQKAKVHILHEAICMIKIQTQMAVDITQALSGERRRQSELNDKIKNIISDIVDGSERQKAIKLCQQDKKCLVSFKYFKSTKFSEALAKMKEKEIELVQHERKTRKRKATSVSAGDSSSQERFSIDSPLNTHDSSLDSLASTSASTNGQTEKNIPRSIARPTEGIMLKKAASRSNLRSKPTREVVNLVSDSDGESSVLSHHSSIIEVSDSSDEEVCVIAEKDNDLEFVSMNSSNNKSNYSRQRYKKTIKRQPVFTATWPEVHRNSITQEISSTSDSSDSDDVTMGRVAPVAMVVSQSLFEEHMKVSQDTEPISVTPDKNSQTMPAAPMYNMRDKFLPLDVSKRINIVKFSPTLMSAMKVIHDTKNDAPNPGRASLTKAFASYSKTSQVEPSKMSEAGVCKPLQVQPTAEISPPVSRAELPSVSSQATEMASSEAELILPETPNTSLARRHLPVRPAPTLIRNVLNTKAKTMQLGKIAVSGARNLLKGKPVLLSKVGNGIKLSKLPVNRPLPLSSTPVTIMRGEEGSKSELDNTVTLYHPSEELSETRTVMFQPLKSVSVPSISQAGPKIRTPREESASIKVMLPKKN